jgi:choline monooxygenase
MTTASTIESLPETLPAAWYWDDGIYQRERDRIFRREWALVGREAQLAEAGDWVAHEVAGWPIFVVRGADGTVRGFHNVCRRRAGPLVHGAEGRCRTLPCRYHGWTYDLDGALKRAPGTMVQAGAASAETALFGVRVETWNGLVFARLAPDGEDLARWLGDIPAIAAGLPAVADMTFAGAAVRDGDANWKCYGDNSCEGYHVPCPRGPGLCGGRRPHLGGRTRDGAVRGL